MGVGGGEVWYSRATSTRSDLCRLPQPFHQCSPPGGSLYGQYGCLHQWTTLGCGVSGGCAAWRARSPVGAVPLETQQQSGPVPGGGQHDVQNVIQVQSGAPAPLVAQPEYGEVLTVPGKSMPQLKCAAMQWWCGSR